MSPAAPIYNPLVLGREETLETYVARIPLLERMVEDLRAERPANKLILGQRGMGKTTLLHRLRFAIDDDPELRERWLALAFPEEQYDAARLSDFYLNCLDALGDSLERRGDGDGASRLDARVQQLAGMPENDLAGKALAVLLEEAKRAGKGLVLLVDNADRILEGISSQEQWGLRNLLEQDQRLMLIGAATQPMSCCYDYGKAFYDFFFVQDLAPLREDEAREMLLRLGGRHQLEDRIRAWIDEDRARLRTLVTLTGGNPRTVAMLFGLLAQGTDGDVRSELERLLDLATPLFKARLEELPRQAQQIVDALAQHWHPITAAALSELVRLEQGIVSSQLSRLARQGIVEKVPYFPDTKLAFQIAERFFNIWYLMRSSRRARTKLRWLVHFLRLFYSQPELERDAGQHLRRLRGSGSDERSAEWAEAAYRKALEQKPDFKEALYNLGRCLEERGDVEGAQSHYERAMQLDSCFAHPWVGMGDLHARNRRYVEAESSFRKAIELDSNYMSAWGSLGWLLMFLGRLPEAESAFRRALEIEPAHFACALYLASCLAKQNKTVEAVESLKRLIKNARPALVDQVWDLILDFSREMVRHGKARECLRLLDESELSERWVPLREAMAAVVAESAGYLRRIAPEARGPAEQILEKIDPSLPRKASRWVRSMLGAGE